MILGERRGISIASGMGEELFDGPNGCHSSAISSYVAFLNSHDLTLSNSSSGGLREYRTMLGYWRREKSLFPRRMFEGLKLAKSNQNRG